MQTSHAAVTAATPVSASYVLHQPLLQLLLCSAPGCLPRCREALLLCHVVTDQLAQPGAEEWDTQVD